MIFGKKRWQVAQLRADLKRTKHECEAGIALADSSCDHLKVLRSFNTMGKRTFIKAGPYPSLELNVHSFGKHMALCTKCLRTLAGSLECQRGLEEHLGHHFREAGSPGAVLRLDEAKLAKKNIAFWGLLEGFGWILFGMLSYLMLKFTFGAHTCEVHPWESWSETFRKVWVNRLAGMLFAGSILAVAHDALQWARHAFSSATA